MTMAQTIPMGINPVGHKIAIISLGVLLNTLTTLTIL